MPPRRPQPTNVVDPFEYDPLAQTQARVVPRSEEVPIDIEVEEVPLTEAAQAQDEADPNDPFKSQTRVQRAEQLPAADDPFNSETRVSRGNPALLFGLNATQMEGVEPATRVDMLDHPMVVAGPTSTIVADPQSISDMGLEQSANERAQFATQVVGPPAPMGDPTKVVAPAKPLKLDFSEVLGSAGQVAGAQRIGAQALESEEFLSKYEKEAIGRAEAPPKFDLPSSLEHEVRSGAVRIVEERYRIWIWAVVALLVPALIAVGGVFVYYRIIRMHGVDKEVEALKKADQVHKKAAEEHEKELAR
jgi:hypothetical protein